MTFRKSQFVAMGPIVVLAAIIAAEREPRALGQPDDTALQRARNDFDDPLSPAPTESPTTRKEHARALLKAASNAYEAAVADLNSGSVTDPEVVYRWSRRWMEAEQKVADPAGAAKAHLRRMEELVRSLEGVLKAGNPEQREAKSRVGEYLGYYTREAKQLVEATAKADEVASSPHDAAIEVAEAYFTAALKGDAEAALKLAVPESLAASRRLMEGLKDSGAVESDGKPFSISSVQISRRDAITVNIHVPRLNRDTKEVVLDLKQTNGRWLVTRFAVHRAVPPMPLNRVGRAPISAADGAPPELRGNKTAAPRTPNVESEPKGTRVIILKHAKASDLHQTISQLLDVNSPDFRVAVDARTNRLIVHGTRDFFKEVLPLIEELDVPSAASASDQRPGEGGNKSPPPQQPAEAKP